jgi:hypothetical protein
LAVVAVVDMALLHWLNLAALEEAEEAKMKEMQLRVLALRAHQDRDSTAVLGLLLALQVTLVGVAVVAVVAGSGLQPHLALPVGLALSRLLPARLLFTQAAVAVLMIAAAVVLVDLAAAVIATAAMALQILEAAAEGLELDWRAPAAPASSSSAMQYDHD